MFMFAAWSDWSALEGGVARAKHKKSATADYVDDAFFVSSLGGKTVSIFHVSLPRTPTVTNG